MPPVFGTIFYLAVVLPLTTTGLTGTERSHPIATPARSWG